MKPTLDAEIAGHLRHTQAHGFLVAAQALQAEGQLVPDLIGNDLAVRVLHDETDFRGLLAQVRPIQGRTVVEDGPLPVSVGGEDGFQVPQKGGFAAARLTAQGNIFPLLHLQGNTLQRGMLRVCGVGKGQIFDRKLCHRIASRME